MASDIHFIVKSVTGASLHKSVLKNTVRLKCTSSGSPKPGHPELFQNVTNLPTLLIASQAKGLEEVLKLRNIILWTGKGPLMLMPRLNRTKSDAQLALPCSIET